MAKFKIAPEPTFTVDVEIPRAGGAVIKVPFTFKYRDRTELAELFDAWKEKGAAMAERFAVSEPGLAEITAAHIDGQVEQIQDLVVAWEFDDELSAESIRALVNTSVGAPDAVIAAYSGAFSQARQGN